MKKTEFVSKLSEFCGFEEPDLTLDTQLDTVEEYDSMAMLSMIAFVEKNFRVKISSTQLQNLTDFNSIVSVIGEEKFEAN